MSPVEFDYSPEENPEEQNQREQSIKTRIAMGVLVRDISDDNPSDTNGYTGLEQVIMYCFETEDYTLIQDLKEEIMDIAQDFEEEEYEEDFPQLEEEDERKILVKIARFVLENIITDDNRSSWSGLSGLEQAIYYEFGPVGSIKLLEIKKKIIGMQMDLRGGSTVRNQYNPDDYVLDEII